MLAYREKVASDPSIVLNSEAAGQWNTFGLFGETSAEIAVSPSMSPVIYGFAGYAYDAVTGNYLPDWRVYSPAIGRWLQQDPIGLEGEDENPYRYVGNAPLRYTDPDGLKYRTCVRPLKGSGGKMAGPLYHEYLQFDDGKTYSFGPAAGESAFNGISTNEIESGEGSTCTAYSEDSSRDEEIKKRAEENLLKNYKLLKFNCQDFVRDSVNGSSK